MITISFGEKMNLEKAARKQLKKAGLDLTNIDERIIIGYGLLADAYTEYDACVDALYEYGSTHSRTIARILVCLYLYAPSAIFQAFCNEINVTVGDP